MDTLDPATLDDFRTELVRAGFEPVTDTEGLEWEGPIAPAFAGLTTATVMRLRLNEGWPFIPPSILVQGLATDHVAADGRVCLWRGDDSSREWMTLNGILRRIDAWCQRARDGFDPADRALDAHLNFEKQAGVLAVFDPEAFRPASGFVDGQMDEFSGTAVRPRLIEIQPGRASGSALRGHWYYRDHVTLPPRTVEEFTAVLARGQRTNFERGLDRLRRQVPGGLKMAALIWRRHGEIEFLVLHLAVAGNVVRADALEAAPRDQRTLLRRAGLDSLHLKERVVAVVGCGAIGSHVALLLAESGLGSITLVDRALLRPGHAARHVAGHDHVAEEKAEAVHGVIRTHAPWVRVRVDQRRPVASADIAVILAEAHLTIDATGIAPISELLSRVAERDHRPLLSVALYRGGAVGRVRRQWPERDTPIYRRREIATYPLIPAGKDDDMSLEMGCAAAVNNAAPTSVAAAAALAVQVGVDALQARWQYPDEVIDIYQALDVAPFDRLGRLLPAG